MLTVEWIVEGVRLAAIAAEWEAMLPRDSHPFDTYPWYAAWLAAFGAAVELAVCTVRRDGELVGVFPLQRGPEGLRELGNVHSCITRPVARDPEALTALVEAALAESPQGLEVSLPSEDASVATLVTEARNRRMHPLTKAGSVAPVVDTTGDPEAWRKLSNTKWKARLARYGRKMKRDHEAVIEAVVRPDDLDAWLADGFRLEASGWKGEAGTAILSAPETAAFYRDVAERFQERDQLRLSRIVLDGTPVAFSFCIQMNGRLYSLKTGYDEEWRKLVPGLVLQLEIVERCFELGLDAYELLGVSSEWKEKFGTGTRGWSDLRVYPSGPAGFGRYAYQAKLRPLLRSTYRTIRPQRA